TGISDMNDLARPAKLAAFREEVLARLRQTDLKSYKEHVGAVARRFMDGGSNDIVLGRAVLANWEGEEPAKQKFREVLVGMVKEEDREETAADLLGIDLAELRRLLEGRNREPGR